MVTAAAAAVAALFWGQALAHVDPLLVRVAPLAARALKPGPHVGLAVGVLDGDKTRVLGFGTVTTPGGEQRPDGTTLFEIGSVTKAFTGVLLADAEARGELKLADPANKHLPPDLRLPGEIGAQVTLADLATHRAGLPRIPVGLVEQARDFDNPYADFTRARLAAALRALTLDPIGRGENYSNLGAGLAGHALVHASGQRDYDALVRRRIAGPLKLADTAEALTGEQRSRLASGFGVNRKLTPPWDFATLPGCGALRSTADDLLAFARVNLGDGDAALAAACRASHAKRAGRVGLFWNRITLSRSKSVAVWHNGGTLGTRAMLVIVPDKGIAVVALCGCGEVGDAVDSLALTLADRLAQQVPAPPAK